MVVWESLAHLFDREIRMNASHILGDFLGIILYMTESMMFVLWIQIRTSDQEIKFSNVNDGVTGGIGQCTKLRKTDVKNVN